MLTPVSRRTRSADAIANEICNFHQGFGLSGATPAPLLLQSGWTDDLFPPEESLRIYNALRASNPGASCRSSSATSGHARGNNDPTMDKDFQDRAAAFFDHYLKGASAPQRRAL